MKKKLSTDFLLSKKNEFLSIFVLVFFVFLSSRALFHSGFYRTIDDVTTVRIVYLLKELRRNNWLNNFPVRWSAELCHRYGYPLYLFYAPLTYYAGALLMAFTGLSHIVATKAVYVLPLIIGPFLFYLAVRQKLKIFPALIAGLFYTLFPFRGYDTYIRGGVGEAWAMAFLPGVMLGVFLIEKNKRIGRLIFSIFLFLSVISHNLSGLLIINLVVIYGFLFLRRRKDFWKFLFLSLGMSAFFWLPAFVYLKDVKVSYSAQNTDQIFNFLVPLSHLFKLDFKLLPEDRFSPLFSYLILIAAAGFIAYRKKLKQKIKKEFVFWFLVSVVLYFFLSKTSAFLWRLTLPLSRMLQFSWRVLILLSFSLPLLLGILMEAIKKNFVKFFLALLLAAWFLTFLVAFKPKEYSTFYEYHAEDTGLCAATWGEEYLPVWVKVCHSQPPRQDLVVPEGSKLKIKKNKLIDIQAEVEGDKGELLVNRYYFPGWQVLLDGRKLPLNYEFSKRGTIKTNLPAGRHELRVVFTKTRIMWLADLISIISLMIFFIEFVKLAKGGKNFQE